MFEQIHHLLELIKPEYIVSAGYVAMTAIVFVETGLLVGFFLPGDSMLVTAGIFAARGDLDIALLNMLLIPSAIAGDTLGYWIGFHSGPRLFRREKSLLFRPDYLKAAQGFYQRHGGKTIVIARFMPIVRTFAPVVAGIGRMDYRRFLLYNICGGVGWVAGMTLTGYMLGKILPETWLKRLDVIIVLVVFVSILPALVGYVRHRLAGKPETLGEALAAPDDVA